MNELRYSLLVVGHSSTLRAIVALLLVGSAAAAQQGLITEPWSRSVTPPQTSAPAPRPMPESGLAPVAAKAVVGTAAPVAAAVLTEEKARWSPPVVPLLVDPWARTAVLPPPPRPRWLSRSAEIVDPWAKEPVAETPRVAAARAPSTAPRSTIF